VNYDEFIAQKRFTAPATGLTEVPALNAKLFEHQRLLTSWALRRGRAAIFASTGLGKGWMILEWSRVVAEHTGKPVLILAPLAVSQQFAREAEKLGAGLTVCSSQDDVRAGVNVTNYQKLHKFDAGSFGGVACDESSLLKSLDGATRALLIESFKDTAFRLAATATPSPNDFTELGGHAEFLGVMKHSEMLASFFIRDGGSTQDWRLKGHARELFWAWCASWGAWLTLPSDLECDDAGYLLPPLTYFEHIVPATQEDARKCGQLFAVPAATLIEQRRARKGTLASRVSLAVDIVNGSTARKWLLWCDLNSEQDALAKAFGKRCVSIAGATPDDDRVRFESAWREGDARVLITKPSLFGHGLNWQHCSDMAFVGVSHSFEQLYQAVRRCWRYGQEHQVNVHLVSSELEGNVLANVKRKAVEAEELTRKTREYVAGHVLQSVKSQQRDTIEYRPTKKITWPSWLRSELAS
jgi:hypothetical protein